MAIRPDYDIGTVTLTSGSADFTTTGSSLQTAAVQAGDAIITPSGHVLIIASITGQNSGTLFLPCPAAAAGTDLPLRIRFQPDGSRYQGAVRNLIDLLSSGNLEAFAALVGAAGLVPIFTGPGTLDLADPATFGIQDPNGSLGKLAALTLGTRQILQTDDTGNLTLLALAARQILQTDQNGALKAIALAANKLINTDDNGDILLSDITTFTRSLLAKNTGEDFFEALGASAGGVAGAWWLKLPPVGGISFLIQYGATVLPDGLTYGTTTFPTAFVDSDYTVVGLNGNSQFNPGVIVSRNPDVTNPAQFGWRKTYNGTSTTVAIQFDFIAIGRAP